MARFGMLFILVFVTQGTWAQLERDVLPAQGSHETLLHIEKVGRYSIQANSKQGVVLELIDKMVGPFRSDGNMGSKDGRIDQLLEKGTYKLKAHGHPDGEGEVQLVVQPYVNKGTVTSLQDFQLESTELGDYQQRSWRVVHREAGPLRIEIAGRHLSDARLWMGDDWQFNLMTHFDIIEPVVGQPLNYIELYGHVPAGEYILTCYGGPATAWSVADEGSPLYVRKGVQELGEAGVFRHKVSPFGQDFYLVDASASYFEISRREKKQTSISVSLLDRQVSQRDHDGYSSSFDKESKAPRTSVRHTNDNEMKLVRLMSEPGADIEFRFMNEIERRIFKSEKQYFLSTIHSKAGDDSFETTAYLSNNAEKKPHSSKVPWIARNQSLKRRINVTGQIRLFVEVKDEGEYTVEELEDSTGSAKYAMKPFFYHLDPKLRVTYKTPGKSMMLTKGLYSFIVKPNRKGIVSLRLYPVSNSRASAEKTVRPNATWPEISFPKIDHYDVVYAYTNERHEVNTGIVLRELPLDLERPLSIYLAAKETMNLSVAAKTPAKVEIKGGKAQLKLDGNPFNASETFTGNHELSVTNDSNKGGYFTVAWRYHAPYSEAPVPSPIKDIPVIQAGQSYFADYERNDTKFYLLEVNKPGLYRIETSGRMATKVLVRSRIKTELYTGTENGIGRNGLVQQYLKPGQYMVSVETRGESKGRAGLWLKRSTVVEADTLADGSVGRVQVEADQAVVHKLLVSKAGEYYVETAGLNKTFFQRIEDSSGWPILMPSRNKYVYLSLVPGELTYMTMPEVLPSRRVTRFDKRFEGKVFDGKGPFEILFYEDVDKVWEKGGPDVYSLTLPAKAPVTLTLSGEVEVKLVRDSEKPIYMENGTTKELEKGEYRVEVIANDDDQVPYKLKFATDALMEKVPWYLSYQGQLTVRLGESGLVDIRSFGPTDVAGALYQNDQLILESDDTVGDWNLHLSRHLEAGVYELRFKQVGSNYGKPLVSMSVRDKKTLAAGTLPFEEDQQQQGEVLEKVFETGGEGLVHIKGEGSGQIGLTLIRDGQILADTFDELYIPLKMAQYKLLAWNNSGGSGPLTLTAKMVSVHELDVTSPLPEKGPYLLTSTNPTTLELFPYSNTYLYSSAFEEPCKSTTLSFINLNHNRAWLIGQPRQMRNLTVTPDNSVTIALEKNTQNFKVSLKEDEPAIFEVSGVGGFVGVTLSDVPINGARNWNKLFWKEQLSMAVLPGPGNYHGLVWPGSEVGKGRVGLNLVTYPKMAEAPAGNVGWIEPGRSLVLTRSTRQTLGLILGDGLVASTPQGVNPGGVLAAIGTNTEGNLTVGDGRLILINRGNEAAMYRIDMPVPDVVRSGTYTSDFGYEALLSHEGLLKIEMADIPEGMQLQSSQKEVSFRFLGHDGSLITEDLTKVKGRGLLELNHGPGYLRLWHGPPDKPWQNFMGSSLPKSGKTLTSGTRLSNSEKMYEFQLSTPSLMDIVADATGVMAVLKDGEVLKAIGGRNGTDRRLNMFLNPGQYQLWIRPLANVKQAGRLSFSQSEPELIGNEDAPQKMIRPNETMYFRFKTAEKARVGVGLRTQSDALTAVLYDGSYNKMGEGPYILTELAEGDYLLKVTNMGTTPLLFSPLVYGNNGPGDQIPEEILKRLQAEVR